MLQLLRIAIFCLFHLFFQDHLRLKTHPQKFCLYRSYFAESSMETLKSVAIIAAFPIGFVLILIVASFFKDSKKFLAEQEANK